MRVFLFLHLVIFNYSIAQQANLRVNYVRMMGDIPNKETLIANSNLALHSNELLNMELSDEMSKIKQIGENEYAFREKKVKLNKRLIYKKLNTSTIYLVDYKEFDTIYIQDNLPNFHWKIHSNEQKKIGSYVCTKATCMFRGTQIVAFFTEEIPLPFGPWKFNGLPGLMLEVYSVDAAYKDHWIAQEIIYPYKIKERISFELPKKAKLVTFKEHIIKSDSELKKSPDISSTRLPQGVNVSKTTIKRIGIEKKFEWEE